MSCEGWLVRVDSICPLTLQPRLYPCGPTKVRGYPSDGCIRKEMPFCKRQCFQLGKVYHGPLAACLAFVLLQPFTSNTAFPKRFRLLTVSIQCKAGVFDFRSISHISRAVPLAEFLSFVFPLPRRPVLKSLTCDNVTLHHDAAGEVARLS